jgi:hypothetical protein
MLSVLEDKVILVFNKSGTHHEDVWRSGGIMPLFLIPEVVADPIAAVPWETPPTTHWIGGWVCPRASVDALASNGN